MQILALLAALTFSLTLPIAGSARTAVRPATQQAAATLAIAEVDPVVACVADGDGDGVCDPNDNCPDWPNPSQRDTNQDGTGDACRCGDVSADGQVTTRDFADALMHVFVGRELAAPDLCDVLDEADGGPHCDIWDVIGIWNGILRRDSLGRSCVSHRRLVEHVLGRTGYGGDDWTRWRIQRLGIAGYLREQLEPEEIGDPEFEAALDPYLNGPYATWDKSIPLLESQYCNSGNSRCTDRIEGTVRVNANLAEIKLLRAIYSRRQLETVLRDFWLNHFNVDGSNKIAIWAEQSYEQDSLRPHLLGRFEDLAQAMAESLAMLDYLDQRRSRVGRLNENFAREQAELHTVGKVGTFDELDVQEMTRILTGYTYDGDRVFEYRPNWHDTGVKVVTLEDTEPWVFDGTQGCDGIPADAFDDEGQVLICLLSRHPKTAERLSRKLIGRFVDEQPDEAFVERVAEVWRKSRGDLAQVMEAILVSEEFLSMRATRTKVKRPHLLAASLARAVGPGSEGSSLIANQSFSTSRQRNSFNGIMGDLGAMGEPLYRAGPPTGFPEVSPAWASAGGVVFRLNLADRIVAGVADPSTHWQIGAGAGDAEIVARLEVELVPGGLTDATRGGLLRLLAALSGATPEQKVQQAASAIVASPEFLLH